MKNCGLNSCLLNLIESIFLHGLLANSKINFVNLTLINNTVPNALVNQRKVVSLFTEIKARNNISLKRFNYPANIS